MICQKLWSVRSVQQNIMLSLPNIKIFTDFDFSQSIKIQPFFLFTTYNKVYFEYQKYLLKFIFENDYKQRRFSKEDSYYLLRRQRKKDLVIFPTNLTKKVGDSSKVKEHDLS